jgi:MFS family permease
MVVELRGSALVAVILLASGLDFLLFGQVSLCFPPLTDATADQTCRYDQGLFGGILGGDRFKDMLGRPSATMVGLVTGIYDIGCAIGAVLAFVYGERIGRKKSIIFANVIVIIGATIQTACYSYTQMAIARVIAGVGVGLSTVAVPILQSETLPSHNRGALLVVQSALIIIGVAIASWLCFATLFAQSSLQWRFPIACQILFSLLVLLCCPFLCETPRWLAKHGRTDEARHVISRLLDKPEDDAEVQGQLAEILEAISAETEDQEPSWGEVFSNATKTRNLQRVLLGMGPYLMNQW